MASSDGSIDRIDQVYTPSPGGGVYTTGNAYQEKSFRRRAALKEKTIDIETASVEQDDGIEERDFQKKQVRSCLFPLCFRTKYSVSPTDFHQMAVSLVCYMIGLTLPS